MGLKIVAVSHCNSGDILAKDVFNNHGVLLLGKNTVITEYTKNKFINMGIASLCIYDSLNYESKDNNAFNIRENYLEDVLLIKEIINDLIRGKNLESDKVLHLANCVYGLNVSYQTIRIIDELSGIDEYTLTHSINTAFYAMIIGKWLGLTENEVKKIIQCGLLHDIGKVLVPPEILNKSSVLTRDEFEIIKKHTLLGYSMLNDIDGIDGDIKHAVLLHHERVDCSGYPFGMAADYIGIYERIVAVADVYDAMTTNRVYKCKTTPFEAFLMFKTVGIGIFDARVVGVFLKNIASYYTGTNVLLSNGIQGKIVYIPPHDIISPVVQVGNKYLDLSRERNIKIAEIISGTESMVNDRIG
jgi:putative nucleotidyltransferase with HDIG domain